MAIVRWIVFCLLTVSLSGCLGDFWDQLNAPDADVRITPMQEGWNTDNRFRLIVAYEDPLDLRIELDDGQEFLRYDWSASEASFVNETYVQDVTLEIPEGRWILRYFIDDTKWGEFPAWVDTVLPEIVGLETIGEAIEGRYTIGLGASHFGEITIRRQSDRLALAHSLPYEVVGLSDGIHAYDVYVEDQAGNVRVYTVQIRAGDAKFMPTEGIHDFGIIARYTTQVAMWDLTEMSVYASRPEAAAQQADYFGEGFGIEPSHPDVQAVVDEVVTSEMNTLEASWALFNWMFEELEYTEDRLTRDDLLTASETIQNQGGVCRDLAALFVSLARAAGIPSRLVTGYLAGDVNGFHAWVEVFAPSPGQEPWVPIDVSPIDGPFDIVRALGSFAVQRADYLPLATVQSDQEQEGWSTAISAEYTYNGDAPVVAFGNDLDIAFESNRNLCIDDQTLGRALQTQCDGFTWISRDFPVQMEQTLDYGVDINGKTTTKVKIALPATPELIVYGADWEKEGLFVHATFKT